MTKYFHFGDLFFQSFSEMKTFIMEGESSLSNGTNCRNESDFNRGRDCFYVVIGEHFVFSVIRCTIKPDKTGLGKNDIWVFYGPWLLKCNYQAELTEIG